MWNHCVYNKGFNKFQSLWFDYYINQQPAHWGKALEVNIITMTCRGPQESSFTTVVGATARRGSWTHRQYLHGSSTRFSIRFEGDGKGKNRSLRIFPCWEVDPSLFSLGCGDMSRFGSKIEGRRKREKRLRPSLMMLPAYILVDQPTLWPMPILYPVHPEVSYQVSTLPWTFEIVSPTSSLSSCFLALPVSWKLAKFLNLKMSLWPSIILPVTGKEHAARSLKLN